MKKCPMCAEKINDEARICHFCGAKFNVSIKGYCSNCHQIMDADENKACIRCGSNLVDLQIRSEYIPPQVTPTTPLASTTSSSANQPRSLSIKKKSNLKWILISLFIFVCICILATQTKTIVSYLKGKIIPGFSGTSQPTSSRGLTSTPAQVVVRTSTPLPVGAAFDHPSIEKGAACFMTEGYGLTCLDEAGWHIFTEENSILEHNSIYDIATCPDETLLLGNQQGAFLWNGIEWQSIYTDHWASHVACGSRGEIWITYGDGASTFDGTEWTHFEAQQVIADHSLELISDCTYGCFGYIAISPNGDFWTLSEGNLVHFNGDDWFAIQSPAYLLKIVTDLDGIIWAIADDMLYQYLDGTWNEYQNPSDGQFSDLLVDEDNRIWLSTYNGKVLVFSGENWLTYDATAGDQIGPDLTYIALDGRGRLWVGSNWGLGVFDGQVWIAYHMNTADLGDYEIGEIAVLGGGPDLPPPAEREEGSVTGKIIIVGDPASKIKVEVCQFHFGGYVFFATSPCGGKHFHFEGTTDENGAFQFEHLPPGHYSLYYLRQDEQWAGGKNFTIMPGEELVLPDITTDE